MVWIREKNAGKMDKMEKYYKLKNWEKEEKEIENTGKEVYMCAL